MLDIGYWRLFDAGVFALQLVLISGYAVKWVRVYSPFVGLVMAFALWVFATPLTLITYNRVIGDALDLLPRFWPWHFKWVRFDENAGLSLNDLLVGVLAIGAVGELARYWPWIVRYVRVIWAVLAAAVLIGYLSVANNPAPLVVSALLYVTRNFGIYFVGAIAGARVGMLGVTWPVFRSFFTALVVVFLLSVLGYASLAPEYRWNRYVVGAATVSIMPTQNAAFVGAFALWLIWSGAARRWWEKLASGVAVIVPWIGLFKYGIFYEAIACSGFVLAAFVRSRSPLVARWCALALLATAVLAPCMATVWNFSRAGQSSQDYSLLTRHLQARNLLLTLQEGPVETKLFGLGWKQPYGVSERFLADDNFAFGADDPIEQGLAINIQLPVLQVLRSTGLVGVLCVAAAAVYTIAKMQFRLSDGSRYQLLVPAFFVSYLFSFGEFAADFVILAAFWSTAVIVESEPGLGVVCTHEAPVDRQLAPTRR